MLPVLPRSNSKNVCSADAKLHCDSTCPILGGTDTQHLFGGEFRGAVTLSRAGYPAVTTFTNFVAHIFRVRTGKKMVRTGAFGVVAGVKHVKSFGDRSNKTFVRKTMRCNAVFSTAHHHTVAARIFDAVPTPAPFFSALYLKIEIAFDTAVSCRAVDTLHQMPALAAFLFARSGLSYRST